MAVTTPSFSSSYTLADAKSMCVSVSTTIDDGWECGVVLAITQKAIARSEFHEEAWVLKNGDVYSDLTDAEKVSSLQLKGPCYPVLIKRQRTFVQLLRRLLVVVVYAFT